MSIFSRPNQFETRGRKKKPDDERREIAFVVRMSSKEWDTLNQNWKESGIRFRTAFARDRLLNERGDK